MFEDDGRMLTCPVLHPPALLVTEYDAQRLEPDERMEGMFRYHRWLPTGNRPHDGGPATFTYRSPRLSRISGLPNLWLGFNGYWPEAGATLPTGTFKDLEAEAVLARLGDGHRGVTLVLASAGNTAAAFARACSDRGQRCLVVVPQSGLDDLRFVSNLDPCVIVVALRAPADYSDAIALADRITATAGAACVATGGVANVARVDGVGTTMLAAAERIGRIPDYYLQAVGSGAGGIAAHQAARRLVADGRFGDSLPRLLLSQNAPYAPMVNAWRARRRELCFDGDERARIRRISARVLSSRSPAYSVAGGVFDALTESCGGMLAVTNAEAAAARELVEGCEGVDLDPAAAVAAASLLRAVRDGWIEPDAVVLLNLSGGGRRRLARRRPPAVIPALELDPAEAERGATIKRIVDLIG